MYDITKIVEAVISLIIAVVSAFVIPYIKSKTTTEQQDQLLVWVRIAVSAAEQIYVGTNRGQEKKQYVLEWLHSHNITFDEDKIDAIIESAVYELGAAQS